MPKSPNGFTIIELIMVIVILAILAAVALPRFYELQTEARVAKMQAALGAIKSASAIAHSAALVNNQTSASGSVTMEGMAIRLVYGYPDIHATTAASSGIVMAAGGLADYTLSISGDTLTVQVDDSHADCKITYAEPAAAGALPTLSAAPVTTDCN